MVWTFSILMRQKRSWALYAEKRKLRYKSNALMDAPELSGVMGEHTVSLFASEHVSEDARGVRKLTAIEVNLNSTMPVGGGVASNGMIPILKTMRFKVEHMPKHKQWKKAYVASCDNRNAMRAYLTDERVKALCGLMAIPNSWVILIFKGDAMLLRIDTADPLHDPKRLDQMIKKVVGVVEVLELKKGERERLKSESLKAETKDIELDVDEDVLDSPSALTLEDDVVQDEIETASDEDVPKEKAEGDKPSASSKKSKKKK